MIFTINRNTLLISGVDEPFLEQNVRYHCPVFCVLNFTKPKTPIYQRKIYLFDRGNYNAFSNDLVQIDWLALRSNIAQKYSPDVDIERFMHE